MTIDWSDEKSEWLEKNRGVSFEMLVSKITKGDTLLNMPHHNRERYPNQYIYVIDIEGYCYMVPYVKSDKGIFLKTIIPSRKMTKRFLGAKNENDR